MAHDDPTTSTDTATARIDAPLTDDVLEAVADATSSHRNSVMRRILGLPVRGRRALAIDRELVSRGLRSPQGSAA